MGCNFRTTAGVLITNWATAQALVFPDNGPGVSCTIAELPVGSGAGIIDIPAAQTNCSMALVAATISNSGWTAFTGYFYPLNLGQFTGRWDTQSPKRFEQMLMDLLIMYGEYGALTDVYGEVCYNPDGSVHFEKTISQQTAYVDSPLDNPGITVTSEYA